MKHLRLLVPDFFPPQHIAAEAYAGVKLPALNKLLCRASAGPAAADSLEDRLCSAFGAQGIAPVRAAADGLDTAGSYWLCADPVRMQLQPAQALLIPDVVLSHAEAAGICASLNEYFADMGLRFAAPHPRRWYVQTGAEPQMMTTSLRQAAWGDAKAHQPQGADALCWQRMLTEAQMLIHAHPLNQARAARGEPAIDSLWLWGGGRAVPLQKNFDAVGGDSELAATFARVAGAVQAASLRQLLAADDGRGLWVCDLPGEALRRGDLHAWREAIQAIEREVAQPLLQALHAGQLQRVTLEVLQSGGGRCFDLARADLWKLWRVARPMARYAV
jgi:hypothetical protein